MSGRIFLGGALACRKICNIWRITRKLNDYCVGATEVHLRVVSSIRAMVIYEKWSSIVFAFLADKTGSQV